MKSNSKMKGIPSLVGVAVVGIGGLVLFLFLLKWAWNTFFAGVLGLHLIDSTQTVALFFWIVILLTLYIGGKESKK